MKKELSNCCTAPAEVNCADEGTCCYICTKCEKACDVLQRGNRSAEEWENEFDSQIDFNDGLYWKESGELVCEEEMKEFIRQQRQEAYVEGMNHAMKDNNKMVKYFEKKAIREFAEYLINDPKFHIEYQHNDGYIHDVSNDIREALEVYEGK